MDWRTQTVVSVMRSLPADAAKRLDAYLEKVRVEMASLPAGSDGDAERWLAWIEFVEKVAQEHRVCVLEPRRRRDEVAEQKRIQDAWWQA